MSTDLLRPAPARCNPLADGTPWKATLLIELPEAPRAVLLAGKPARLGCTHPDYAVGQDIPPALLALIARDLSLSRKRCDT